MNADAQVRETGYYPKQTACRKGTRLPQAQISPQDVLSSSSGDSQASLQMHYANSRQTPKDLQLKTSAQ